MSRDDLLKANYDVGKSGGGTDCEAFAEVHSCGGDESAGCDGRRRRFRRERVSEESRGWGWLACWIRRG